jgi:hypothetical protein
MCIVLIVLTPGGANILPRDAPRLKPAVAIPAQWPHHTSAPFHLANWQLSSSDQKAKLELYFTFVTVALFKCSVIL